LTILGEAARVPRTEPCVACQTPVVISGPGFNAYGIYCQPCRRRRCPECSHKGGRHNPRCRYDQRKRYVPRPVRNLVPPEDLVRLYEAYRWDLLRRAAGIVGFQDAEDAVQDASLYLVRCLPTLAYLSVVYFRACVRSAALMTVRRRRVRGHDREVPIGTAADLTDAEQRRRRAARGGRSPRM
jgi:hypothetical protein